MFYLKLYCIIFHKVAALTSTKEIGGKRIRFNSKATTAAKEKLKKEKSQRLQDVTNVEEDWSSILH